MFMIRWTSYDNAPSCDKGIYTLANIKPLVVSVLIGARCFVCVLAIDK